MSSSRPQPHDALLRWDPPSTRGLLLLCGLLVGVFVVSGGVVLRDGARGESRETGPMTAVSDRSSVSADTGDTPKKLTFTHACSPGERTTVAAVGDVLLHGRLQRQAYREGPATLWTKVRPLLAAADVTYATLEGTVAPGVLPSGKAGDDPGKVFDDRIYSSYPSFNYHPVVLDGLKTSGVDVVSTATNHSLDRDTLGIDKTLTQLWQREMQATGTRPSTANPRTFWAVTDRGGFRLAWIGCTYGTNGRPDEADQVLHCYKNDDRLLQSVARLSNAPDIDAVIVTPHWGKQYTQQPRTRQVNLAHRLVEAGATAVIGSHPHVLQPWDKYVTDSGREGFILYSLGNFVSGQGTLARRTTLVLYLGLTRTPEGVRVNGVRYVPAYMRNWGDTHTLMLSEHNPALRESRAHATDLLGTFNLHASRPPIRTTPNCDSTRSSPFPPPSEPTDAPSAPPSNSQR